MQQFFSSTVRLPAIFCSVIVFQAQSIPLVEEQWWERYTPLHLLPADFSKAFDWPLWERGFWTRLVFTLTFFSSVFWAVSGLTLPWSWLKPLLLARPWGSANCDDHWRTVDQSMPSTYPMGWVLLNNNNAYHLYRAFRAWKVIHIY